MLTHYFVYKYVGLRGFAPIILSGISNSAAEGQQEEGWSASCLSRLPITLAVRRYSWGTGPVRLMSR